MKESQKLGMLASIVNMLSEAGSWTGRTHIQKFVYFAQELLGLPADYEFVLYQRGPYSFDLDDDIRSVRSIGVVDINPAPQPYGPSYFTTSLGMKITKFSPLNAGADSDLTRLAGELTSVAKKLGPGEATNLELLATTLYVMRERGRSTEDVVDRVTTLKPRFSKDNVKQAIDEVRRLEAKFGRQSP